MKAIVFKEKGIAENVLAIEETDLPDPQKNEILIKVLASPINPNNFMFI